ncbi:hypothetical protein ISN45_Aa05g011180 [Arabidopsis thaliana x Arabidopsis arenosa]|uniref:Uncharacterized protein n=1 Tax=Arabidopsis thaliana x Arabidopsis arenosa TaxID=1240361 RepID=A0A8T1ZLZ4_9BRAS|nr:hypothetical protein ISN45_Aa05g011180 [Arabidopsis thaliana x Arabidopsis arenosa]
MITYLDNSDFESELLFFCKRKDQSGSGNQGPRQRAAALAALPYAFNSSSALRKKAMVHMFNITGVKNSLCLLLFILGTKQ